MRSNNRNKAKSVSDSPEGRERPKRVTYRDQQERHERKARRRQKHTQDAYKNLERLMREKGPHSEQTVEALELFVEKSCEAAVYLLDQREYSDASRVLEECARVLKNEVKGSNPKLLFKVYYRLAELTSAQGLSQESLVYLTQAISMAEEQEARDKDPLGCMPSETYLNAAIAFQYANKLSEALEAARKGIRASQRAVMALSEVQQQPKAFRDLTRQDAQQLIMVQLDIQIQGYLSQGQTLEKLNRFEEASSVLQQGKQLLEQHFGPHHPMMSDFTAAEHELRLQLAPNKYEPGDTFSRQSQAANEVTLDGNNIAALLDKRSDLMKKGRVKRVYYQVTETMQARDMRGEFADLEDLEEKQPAEMNSCATTQQSWMQRQQLMAMRQQQDEQFRMMELLLSTQSRAEVACTHPQVYLPMHFVQPMQQPLSSSSSSSSTCSPDSESPPRISTPVDSPHRKTATPRILSPPKSSSSESSRSDACEDHIVDLGISKNFHSVSSMSDMEEPPAFTKMEISETVEAVKPLRRAGIPFKFHEKRQKIPKRPTQEAPPVIVTPPLTPSTPSITQKVKPKQPKVDMFVIRIIIIQRRWRHFLKRKKERVRTGHYVYYYVKVESFLFRVSVVKAVVERTIKRKLKKTERIMVRHHDEQAMHQEAEQTFEKVAQTYKRDEIYFQINATCLTQNVTFTAEQTQLIPFVEFPLEFSFLNEYLKEAISITMVKDETSIVTGFKLLWKRLSWDQEMDLSNRIRAYLHDLKNKAVIYDAVYREKQKSISTKDSDSDQDSQLYRIEEVDCNQVRTQLRQAEQDGKDMEALRLKIQFEARQIMEAQKHRRPDASQLKLIVHSDYRNDRDWKDVIRLQKAEPETRFRELYLIVKVQALVRGYLTRINCQRSPVWRQLYDFVVNQNQDYYLVRVFKAPRFLVDKFACPYQVVATRYMEPSDTYRLRLQQLPCSSKQDMIENIQIVVDRRSPFKSINEITFDGSNEPFASSDLQSEAEQRFEPVLEPQRAKLGSLVLEAELLQGDGEFIDDWVPPKPHQFGVWQIRKFAMKPSLVVTFNWEQRKEDFEHLYSIHVVYTPEEGAPSAHYLLMRQLPVKINYMVYFIRRMLKVYIDEGENKIQYAALGNYRTTFREDRVRFDQEMQRLRRQLGLKKASVEQEQRLMREAMERSRTMQNTRFALTEKFEMYEHNKVYIVQVLQNVPHRDKIVPYRVLVYRADDRNDEHYLSCDTLDPGLSSLKVYLLKHLLIVLHDDTQLIYYTALTKLGRMQITPPPQISGIIKIQAHMRRHLFHLHRVRAGWITKFIMPVKKAEIEFGRRLIVTVWRVECTKRRTKTKTSKSKDVKNGQVINEEVKADKVEEVEETVIAHNFVFKNYYNPSMVFEKAVMHLPDVPLKELPEVLRSLITPKWKNQFVNRGLVMEGTRHQKTVMSDWIDDVDLSHLSGLQKARTKSKQTVSKDLKRFMQRIGQSRWTETVIVRNGSYYLRMMESFSAQTLDEILVRIIAHPAIFQADALPGDKAEDGQPTCDESQIVGELVLSVRETVKLLRRSLRSDQMKKIKLEDLIQSVSYMEKSSQWEKLLQKYSSVQPENKRITLDLAEFANELSGVNYENVQLNVREIRALMVLQRYVRRFLERTRYRKLMHQPGYATSTGVFQCQDVYLVYVLNASRDQDQFFLTLKQKLKGANELDVILKNHPVSEQVVKEADALYKHDRKFKLMRVTKQFEEQILKTKVKGRIGEGQTKTESVKRWLAALIQKEF